MAWGILTVSLTRYRQKEYYGWKMNIPVMLSFTIWDCFKPPQPPLTFSTGIQSVLFWIIRNKQTNIIWWINSKQASFPNSYTQYQLIIYLRLRSQFTAIHASQKTNLLSPASSCMYLVPWHSRSCDTPSWILFSIYTIVASRCGDLQFWISRHWSFQPM